MEIEIHEDEEFYDKEAFLEEYNKPDSTHREVNLIKKYFPSKETTLDQEKYTLFLTDYMKWNVHELTTDDEEMLKQTHDQYSGLAMAFMEQKKKKEVFGLEDVYKDVVSGDLLHYIHDVIDHTADVAGADEADIIDEL